MTRRYTYPHHTQIFEQGPDCYPTLDFDVPGIRHGTYAGAGELVNFVLWHACDRSSLGEVQRRLGDRLSIDAKYSEGAQPKIGVNLDIIKRNIKLTGIYFGNALGITTVWDRRSDPARLEQLRVNETDLRMFDENQAHVGLVPRDFVQRKLPQTVLNHSAAAASIIMGDMAHDLDALMANRRNWAHVQVS